MFMNFAGVLIGQLEQFVRFINRLFMDAPRLSEFFDVLDTESAVRDRAGRGRSRPHARPGRIQQRVVFL